jgi:hypothetical protein
MLLGLPPRMQAPISTVGIVRAWGGTIEMLFPREPGSTTKQPPGRAGWLQ